MVSSRTAALHRAHGMSRHVSSRLYPINCDRDAPDETQCRHGTQRGGQGRSCGQRSISHDRTASETTDSTTLLELLWLPSNSVSFTVGVIGEDRKLTRLGPGIGQRSRLSHGKVRRRRFDLRIVHSGRDFGHRSRRRRRSSGPCLEFANPCDGECLWLASDSREAWSVTLPGSAVAAETRRNAILAPAFGEALAGRNYIRWRGPKCLRKRRALF